MREELSFHNLSQRVRPMLGFNLFNADIFCSIDRPRMGRTVLWVLFCVLSAESPILVQKTEALVEVRVGAILDMETLVGKMCWISISMAVQDFYSSNSNYTTRLVLHLRDGKASSVSAGSAGTRLSLYLKLPPLSSIKIITSRELRSRVNNEERGVGDIGSPEIRASEVLIRYSRHS